MLLPRIAAPLNHEPIPSLLWIEVSSTLQLPSFHIVGLPGPEVAEARERVRAAILSSGFEFPRRRVVLNLSPASVRKHGAGLDLAMALSVLIAGKLDDRSQPQESWVAWGELGLDGLIKPSGQILRAVYAAWKQKINAIIVSHGEYETARQKLEMIGACGEFEHPSPRLFAASSLTEAWELFSGAGGESQPVPLAVCPKKPDIQDTPPLLPISSNLERILGAAAAGGHHLLLLGPRGVGKSHALEWFRFLLPEPSRKHLLMQSLLEELRTGRIASTEGWVRRIGTHARPAALTGSASHVSIRPGEFSLAHGGLLLADELPEWPRDSREALREPLERGLITLTRVGGNVELPAQFVLAATGNLCPCGGWPPELPYARSVDPNVNDLGSPPLTKLCRCSLTSRNQYLSRLSGPILDRIDLTIRMAPTMGADIETQPNSDPQVLKNRVETTRAFCMRHWGMAPALLPARGLKESLMKNLDSTKVSVLGGTQSLRSRHKILRVAISLAAWDQLKQPAEEHFMEAACYRAENLGLA